MIWALDELLCSHAESLLQWLVITALGLGVSWIVRPWVGLCQKDLKVDPMIRSFLGVLGTFHYKWEWFDRSKNPVSNWVYKHRTWVNPLQRSLWKFPVEEKRGRHSRYTIDRTTRCAAFPWMLEVYTCCLDLIMIPLSCWIWFGKWII